MVRAYVTASTDDCVREMFRRYVRDAGGTCVLFPFQRLEPPTNLAGLWAPPVAEQKEANRRNREHIQRVKLLVLSHAPPREHPAWEKTEHYLRALDDAIAGCDWTATLIEALQTPVPRRTLRDLMEGESPPPEEPAE